MSVSGLSYDRMRHIKAMRKCWNKVNSRNNTGAVKVWHFLYKILCSTEFERRTSGLGNYYDTVSSE